TGVETDVMGVVVATERECETVDRDAIELARVAVRLLDLADQGAVHRHIPPSPTRAAPRPRPVDAPADRWSGRRVQTLHRDAVPVIPRIGHGAGESSRNHPGESGRLREP